MTVLAGTGLTRVTIVAPRTRVDLSVPDDVPLADLLPGLLHHVGEDTAATGASHGGWALSRLGGAPLDTDRTPTQLGLKHGEELQFTPREVVAPEAVFDDVVDAIAGGVADAGQRWGATTTRRCGLAVLGGAALAGAALLALYAPAPRLPAGLAALVVGLLLLLTAAIMARALGDARAGLVLAAVAQPYGFVGGLLLVTPHAGPTRWGAGPLLLGAVGLLLFTVLAGVAVAYQVPAFVGAATVSAAGAVATLVVLLTGARPVSAAAVLAALCLAAVPALPMLAFRLARLPLPTIPTTTEELKSDAVQVAGADVLARTGTAGRYLTALLTAVSVLALGCVPVLLGSPHPTSWALALVVPLVLLCRARTLPVRVHRLPLLLAGLLGLATVLVAATVTGSPAGVSVPAGARLTVAVALLLLTGAVAATYGLVAAGRRSTPVWGRVLDVVEVVLGLAVVPLALGACGLYTLVRALNG